METGEREGIADCVVKARDRSRAHVNSEVEQTPRGKIKRTRMRDQTSGDVRGQESRVGVYA
jgi:hypothetical protein